MGEHHRSHEAEARSESGREQRRHSGKHVRSKKDCTEGSRVHAETEIEPVGGEALHHEAAGKGVEGEQARQLQDHVPGIADAQERLHGRRSRRSRVGHAHFGGRRQTGEEEKEQHPESGIQQHDRPVALELRQHSATQGPGGGRNRADQRVPGEDGGAGPRGNDLRERRLLDRQKRPNLVATWADDADRSGQDQEQDVARVREDQAGGGHESGTDDQHAASPDTIGSRGQVERDDGIPRQRQRQQQAGLGRTQAKAGQIEHQDDGQRTVCEQARDAGEE